MKTLKIILSILFMVIIVVGCKTTKKIDKISKTTEIELPFDGDKYQTDKTTFRTVQSGVSNDISTSREIAKTNARSDLSYSIETVVKNSTDIYSNQLNEVNGYKFEKISRQVSRQILTNIETIEKIYFDKKTGKYTCWVLMEVKKEDIVTHVDNSTYIERIEFDKYQYEKILEKEMENYKNSKSPINE